MYNENKYKSPKEKTTISVTFLKSCLRLLGINGLIFESIVFNEHSAVWPGHST